MILTTAFIILSALLLWNILGARGKWVIKSTMILVTFAFSFLLFKAMDSYKGWPSGDPIPKQSQFISGIVIQPDPSTGSPGEIYLWLIPVKEENNIFYYSPNIQEPRAYKVGFSTKLSKAIDIANIIMEQGKDSPGQVKNNVLLTHTKKGSWNSRKFNFISLPPKSNP